MQVRADDAGEVAEGPAGVPVAGHPVMADALVMEGLERHGLYDSIWQCPTVLVPVEIDGRGKELCILRPIHSERAMTATAARLPGVLLEELKTSILALPGISGLAYDLTSKPPGTIEWE